MDKGKGRGQKENSKVRERVRDKTRQERFGKGQSKRRIR